MSDGCIFCSLVKANGANIIYRDKDVVAFPDIHPQAPTHLLIVPRQHLQGVATLTEADRQLAGALLIAARRLAEQLGVADQGYRLVINTGSHAGQTVPHLHVHFLAGQRFTAGIVPPSR